MKTRYNNIDLFRIICLLGVLVLHNENQSTLAVCISSLGEMSVSFFFMMSGALAMHDDSGQNWKNWFKKIVKKLIIPWAIACFIYVLENVFFEIKNEGTYSLFDDLMCFKENGYPIRGWHLWFMYSFIEMYLCIPLFKYIRRLNRSVYNMLIPLTFVLANVLSDTPWPLIFLRYVWLFICGDFIMSYFTLEKYDVDSVKKKVIYISTGMVAVFLILLRLEQVVGYSMGNADRIINLLTSSWLTLIVVFTVVVNTNIPFSTYRVTKRFLWIYIWSNFVGDFWSGIKISFGIFTNNIWWAVVVDTVIVFCASWAVTEICIIFLNKVKGIKILNYDKSDT